MAGFRGLFVKKTTVGTLPDEARKALAGLLTPASRFGARQGILAGPGSPLRVTGTASWQYSVSSGHVVTSREDIDGAMLFGNDGTALTAAVAAAPGSGSRYDLIYLRHLDPDHAEGDPAAVVGVVSGTASGTPVKPAVPAGAVVIAEALMAAGATSTQHANVTITQVLDPTVARGGILPVPNQTKRDALAMWPGLTVYRIDTGFVETCNGATWAVVNAPKQPTRGTATFLSDGAGLGTITHGLGQVPSAVQLTPVFTTDVVSQVFKPTRGALTSTQIQVVCFRTDSSARLLNTSVTVDWVAWP